MRAGSPSIIWVGFGIGLHLTGGARPNWITTLRDQRGKVSWLPEQADPTE
jgi:hypothetical protein